TSSRYIHAIHDALPIWTADDIPPTRTPPRPRPGDRRPALPHTPRPHLTLHDPRLGAPPVTEKIVLAYSGGLDTSVAIGWIHDATDRKSTRLNSRHVSIS